MKIQLKNWLESLKVDRKPNLNEAILYLGELFPLLLEFKNTIQDPGWHAEGDVYIHTDMVLTELYNIFDKKEFVPTPDQRQILILSAILHDIAKPITTYTCEETGRVKASGHEVKGRNYLVFKLLELDLPKYSYLQVLNLVGYHQKPKLLVIKNLPKADYISLNAEVEPELIYWLEIADLRGRISDDIDEQIMYLDEYLKISKEINSDFTFHLSDIPASLSSDLKKYSEAVGRYLMKQNICTTLESAYSKLYEHSRKPYGNTVILCGISGTGKSTFIKNNYSDYTVISMDDIRGRLSNRRDQSKNAEVAIIAKELLKDALRNKKNVVWDATNTRKEFREQLYDLAHRYNSLTTLEVLLDKETNIRRKNKDREYDVPETVISKQIKGFQFPTTNETHVVNYHIL